MAIVDVITTDPGTGPTLAQSLQSSGWQVRTHTSIDTVLGAPPSEQPRCVVVRVEPATAAAARAGDVGRLLAEQEAPVLVLQSGVGVDEAVELMRAGAAGVIARP
ncbi:MAG: hypothetical protein GVY28_09830, partial [Alphaproteobacteria bacterium]|nr:hypothetical protein [Alphaproteobacteria bacterium]